LNARAGGRLRERLFFAFWPNPEVREGLRTLQSSLLLSGDARAVPQENLHLTLAFVGGLEAADISRVRRIGDEQRAARCEIRFDAVEFWPEPQVVVAAVRTIPRALEQLWSRLHDDLRAVQPALWPKRLCPHVTLASRVIAAPALATAPAFAWRPSDFSLIRSDTSGERPSYTVVDTWRLLDDSEPPDDPIKKE
jgi:2'-5' RNA ligase